MFSASFTEAESVLGACGEPVLFICLGLLVYLLIDSSLVLCKLNGMIFSNALIPFFPSLTPRCVQVLWYFFYLS